MDRFTLRLELGYLDLDGEVAVLEEHRHGMPLDQLSVASSVDEILEIRKQAESIDISPELERYIVSLVQATRDARGVALGASPRASLAMMRTCRALALFDGIDFVTPDLIQELAVPVLAHRLVLDNDAKFSGMAAKQVVESVLEQVPVPR